MKRWMRAKHVAWRKVGEDTILIHLRRKKMFGLNETGGFLWHLLDGSRSSADLRELTGTKNSEPHLEDTIQSFLRQLEGLDLVEVADEVLGPSPLPPRPKAGSGAPEILWQEELLKTAQSGCLFLPSQGGVCNAAPST